MVHVETPSIADGGAASIHQVHDQAELIGNHMPKHSQFPAVISFDFHVEKLIKKHL
jgi:hypothetical protein